jgi:hypothetical protein
LVALAIVNMSVLLPLVVHWHLLRLDRGESEWCFALDVTSQGNPDLLGQLIVKTDKNTNRNKACGKLSTILTTVVNQVMVKIILLFLSSYEFDLNNNLKATFSF